MNWSATIMIATVFAVAFSVGDFIRNPEKYGNIMQRFDNARYEYIDCDCTESFE